MKQSITLFHPLCFDQVDQASSRFRQFFGQPGSNYSSSRSGSPGRCTGNSVDKMYSL